MIIVHVCLSCYFIDDRSYQENELVAAHVADGHDVQIIASTHVHDEQGRRSVCATGEYIGAEGARIIRIPYKRGIPHIVARSLRIHSGVFDYLEEFRPDVILFHGICGWELLTVARYRRKYPNTIVYADTHTDFLNSARSFVSKWVLHYFYYRLIVHRALPQLDKVLCVSTLTREFAERFYRIPDEKLELFLLGGRPLADVEYNRRRGDTRKALGVNEDCILFVQSGKQYGRKRLLEALQCFVAHPDPTFRWLIVGILMDDIREQAASLIASDSRIELVGWKTPTELESLLCAADVYLQPGSQSATMQTSICCRCAIVLEALPGHERYVLGNGWLLDEHCSLTDVFNEISSDQPILRVMHTASRRLADDILDYAQLAKRVLG